MATTATIAAAILGAGSVRLDRYDFTTGTFSGLGDKLGADKFEITPDSDQKQKIAKTREAYGQAVATVVLPKPTKIAITISAADVSSLAAQFQGTATTTSQGAATVTNEAAVATLDKWVKLANRNLATAGFSVKNSAGDATYVLGTDYLVSYTTGEIKPLSTGDITAAEALKVAYTAVAFEETVIKGGAQAQVRVHAVFEGINLVDGQYIECEVWDATLTSGTAFDFLADDFVPAELSGYLTLPAGKDSPYEVRLRTAGA